jgi:hypothetical protein
VLTEQFRKESGLAMVGVTRNVQAQFYAISMERKMKNPAAQAILERAHRIFPE